MSLKGMTGNDDDDEDYDLVYPNDEGCSVTKLP
jgi:hypothetical protein